MGSHHESSSGSGYSSADWLDDHHSIKSRLRAELIQRLPIEEGSAVLDLGCGTGNWTFLLAEKIGSSGRVVGVDSDALVISRANDRRSINLNSEVVEFFNCPIVEYNSKINFDVIILFNTLSYCRSPHEIFSVVMKSLKPTGTLYVKDSDLASDFFWPVDMSLYHKSMMELEKSYGLGLIAGYDAFFARKIPKIVKENKFIVTSTFSQSHTFTSPLNDKKETYIRANALMISYLLELNGHIELSREWAKQFESSNPRCIFARPEFMYSMTEFVFQAKPTSSP